MQLKELLELGDNNFNQKRCTSTQTIQGNTKPDSVKNQSKYRESRYKPIYSMITPINALTPTLTKIAITMEHSRILIGYSALIPFHILPTIHSEFLIFNNF